MKSLIQGGVFDPDSIKTEIVRLERLSAEPEFWNNRELAEKTLGELTSLRKRIEPWDALLEESEELEVLLELTIEEGAQDSSLLTILKDLQERFEVLNLLEMFDGEFDKNGVFLTIHSGAGGTEACDWVQMLYRMYNRWIERKGFKMEIIDLLEAEGGFKSVTIQIKGEYAHGYLKSETGIHRLVRISPFDSGARRHTSFASVFVSPVFDDDIEVEIKAEELRIDTYRASGAGGQHVNKTDSAVRITHLPTGMVVQCQNERSQHKNKAMAMKVLKSRLYEYLKEQQEEEQEKHSQEKKDISWGNQIRSYVFQPYTMVKDHRTNHEVGNINAVMDGDLDGFIEAYLKQE
jgi:peptide chain release factor 2